MPNFDFYYGNTDGTATYYQSTTTASFLQHIWEEHQQRCKQEERIREAALREMEEQRQQEILRQKEMKRYPLFFWKETCEPVLDLRTGKLI